MYKCSNCGLGVVIAENEVIKACSCEAPIIGNMEAVAEGKGGTEA